MGWDYFPLAVISASSEQGVWFAHHSTAGAAYPWHMVNVPSIFEWAFGRVFKRPLVCLYQMLQCLSSSPGVTLIRVSCSCTSGEVAGDELSTLVLTPLWEIHTEFWPLVLIWPSSRYYRHFGEAELAEGKSLSLSLLSSSLFKSCGIHLDEFSPLVLMFIMGSYYLALLLSSEIINYGRYCFLLNAFI